MATVVYNASTGSNTAASGAGPSTAITGSSAAHNSATAGSTTVTLTNSPDLSGVAAGDVIWLNTAGSSPTLYEIASADDGADTVTIVETDAPSIASGSAVNYAIGGKRQHPNAKSGWIEYEERGGWTFQFDSGTYSMDSSGAMASGSNSRSRTVITATDHDGTKPIFEVGVFSFGNWGSADWCSVIGIDFLFDGGGSDTIFLNLNGNGLIFQKNIVRGAFHVGRGASTDCFITGNVFDGVDECRIRASTFSTVVVRNVFKDCADDGLELWDPSAFNSMSVIVRENVFWNNGGHGLYLDLFDGDTTDRRSALIENNVFHDNTSAGCQIDWTTGGVVGFLVILNNAFTDNGTYGLSGTSGVEDETNDSLVDYNLFNGNTTAARLSFTAGPNDSTSAPGYEDEVGGDFTPGSGSALIDAGIATPSAA